MTEKSISWPIAYNDGLDFQLGNVVVKNAPPKVELEHDPALRVILAILMDRANDIAAEVEDISAGLSQEPQAATGNVINDANAQIPTQPAADPQVMVRLAALDNAVASMREWVGSLQGNYVAQEKRLALVEAELGLRKNAPGQQPAGQPEATEG